MITTTNDNNNTVLVNQVFMKKEDSYYFLELHLDILENIAYLSTKRVADYRLRKLYVVRTS